MTTKHRGVDFGRLTLEGALDLAALIEEGAEERYEELAHATAAHRADDVAAFFRSMASSERRHGRQLLARRRSLFGDAPRTLDHVLIVDIEAPCRDDAHAHMPAKEALLLAMRSEQRAVAFFVSALPLVHDPAVRALFEELRREELHHQEAIANELAKVEELHHQHAIAKELTAPLESGSPPGEP